MKYASLENIFTERRKKVMSMPKGNERDRALNKIIDWENSFNIALEFHYPYEILSKIANARNEIHASNILHDAHLNCL